MKCTFFGHGDAPEEIRARLKEVIVDLIKNKDVDTFYVGTHGNFDNMAYSILRELKTIYHMNFFVVLPCVPVKENKYGNEINTIVPEGIENVPPRWGIIYRNKWMIKKSDYVIVYVTREMGGAAKFKKYAQKENKSIINIGTDI